MRAVSETGVDIIGKKMTLLGAGGAAAAILIQAALDKVAVMNSSHVRRRQSRNFMRRQTARSTSMTSLTRKSSKRKSQKVQFW